MIINGQRYEAEPAVEAYVKDLQAENEEQRREILRLTDELKDIEIACYDAAMAREKLKAENARLEEAYQKATGVIAATDCVKCKKDAEPVKHGHWIEREGLDGDIYYECSVCNDAFVFDEGTPEDNNYIFCPHCSAKMKGDEINV